MIHTEILKNVRWSIIFQFGFILFEKTSIFTVVGVLNKVHDDFGHGGQNKMMKAVKHINWWLKRREDVLNHVRACKIC